MIRVLFLAAFAAVVAFAAPAQARMANPGLATAAAPASNVEQAQYYGHRRYYGPRRGYYGRPYWRRGYAYYPRRCWTQRVYTYYGVRYVRRCR